MKNNIKKKAATKLNREEVAKNLLKVEERKRENKVQVDMMSRERLLSRVTPSTPSTAPSTLYKKNRRI